MPFPRRPITLRLWLAPALFCAWLDVAVAADAAKDAQFFDAAVRPILAKHCFACHSHAAGKDNGGLMLDSRGSMLTGGDSGAALVPGDLKQSLLITAVRYEEDYPRMPPKGKLPDADVAVLVEWVRRGAPWPGDDTKSAARPRGKITDEDRRYWAFQPVREPALPEVAAAAWSRNPIDRFVRAKLESAKLAPSPPAERAVLIRRAYFDLVGLPPSPDEVDAFVADDSPEAFEKLIDRLLASPRYGERWARHWLDLVRYAESDGFRIDDYRAEAWRYRDYVIRAFNDDKPYDRFVREQLAGDELAPDDPEAQLATSFLRLGIYEYNNRDVRGQWANMLNDVTDVTADVFLGLGMGCARCHDHKFDPILQKDYYRLQAFLAPILPHDDLPLATQVELASHERRMAAWRAKTAVILAELEALEAPVREKVERGAVEKFPEDIREILARPLDKRTAIEKQLGALAYRQVTYEFDRLDRNFKDAKKQKLVDLRKQLATHAAQKPEPLPSAPIVRDVGREAPPVFIPKKGNDPVAPAFLEVLGEKAPVIMPPAGLDSTGRRTALANWLVRPENPLTARVMVNRIWQYHFGRGLTATSSDFGRLGEPPTHPELLDWLAAQFVKEGWGIKRMHRLMMTSQTYQQAAHGANAFSRREKVAGGRMRGAPHPSPLPTGEGADPLVVDPENRLLWRMSTRRLDAEQVRDALLAATGKLDLTAGGPAVDFSKPRRSIYSRVLRNTRDPLLDVFDAPEGFQSAANRNVTTTPTQALLMINSGYMLEQAEALARRVEEEHASSDAIGKVEAAFRLAFGRLPSDDERRAAAGFLVEQAKRIRPDDVPPPVVKLDKIPFRDGSAVVLEPQGPMRRADVPESSKLPVGDFTVEAFVVLRSTYDDASVRTIAAHWNGDKQSPGWSFGVTSRKSQFKPQMLVLQLWGTDAYEQLTYEPIFSSLNVQLNKPYFVACTVKLGEQGPTGVTFYAKDLSNDDEPLLTSQNAHRVVKIPGERGMFTIGGCGDRVYSKVWDGLVDDVRLSNVALTNEQLLLTAEQLGPTTVGFWEFEPQAGVFKDTSANKLDIRFRARDAKMSDIAPERQAWIDFCHVLLNANEFIYVD
ncbi:MAG: DUF1549 domain-containing protein [Planctomycetia bacterium]|nr:DUF1549 domain-containing protein [Planctomycetia bacterium]